MIPYAGKDVKEKTDLELRIAVILLRHKAGDSHSDIARGWGLTRERVGQIVEAMGGIGHRGRRAVSC